MHLDYKCPPFKCLLAYGQLNHLFLLIQGYPQQKE